MKIGLITFTFLLIACSLSMAAEGTTIAADRFSDKPAEWMVVPVPDKKRSKPYDDFFYKANHSPVEWLVSSKNDGGVSARLNMRYAAGKAKPCDLGTQFNVYKADDGQLSEPYRCIPVDEGWLVAYNRGEWGAALYWFSSQGEDHYKISDHQINQFIIDSSNIYAVEGLVHLRASKGSMITIVKRRGRWEAETFVQLPFSGQAAAVLGSGDFVVVTSETLLRVKPDRTITVLLPATDWDILYPNSVAIEDERFVYVGMRQYVARFDLYNTEKKYDFLIPNRTMVNERTD